MFNHILASLDRSTLAECVLPQLVGMVNAFNARMAVLFDLEPYAKEEMTHTNLTSVFSRNWI